MHTKDHRTSRNTPLANSRVLFVGAHPDDESGLFAGAIKAQVIYDPETTYLLVASTGEGSTEGDLNFVGTGLRLKEWHAAATYLGVPDSPDHRHTSNLPDRSLHKPRHIHRLTNQLVQICKKHHITTIVTPGWQGADGHSDHKAVHIAAILAAAHLRHTGQSITVLGLTNGKGPFTINVDTQHKLGALERHVSQTKGRLDIFKQTPPYKQLLVYESYESTRSWLDTLRARFRLVIPYRRHIPKL